MNLGAMVGRCEGGLHSRFCEEPLNEVLVGAEVRESKAIHRHTKVREAVLRGIRKHTKCSQDRQVPFLRFATAVTVVHQEHIGGEFRGECNGLALAGAEDTSQRCEWLPRRLNVQPFWSVGKPVSDRIRRPLLTQFGHDSGWDDGTSVQGRQHVHVFDQNQIAKRTCISDDNHSSGRSRSLSAASSSCRFCQRRALAAPSRSKSSMVYSSDTP